MSKRNHSISTLEEDLRLAQCTWDISYLLFLPSKNSKLMLITSADFIELYLLESYTAEGLSSLN